MKNITGQRGYPDNNDNSRCKSVERDTFGGNVREMEGSLGRSKRLPKVTMDPPMGVLAGVRLLKSI